MDMAELEIDKEDVEDIDSVRPMEQTSGIYPGIQLSRGGEPRLRRTMT